VTTGPDRAAAIPLVVAEPVALLRAGYREALAAEPDLLVVGEAGDAGATLTLARRLAPRVVLLNPAVAGPPARPGSLAGPGAAAGDSDAVALVRSLMQAVPEARIVAVGAEPAWAAEVVPAIAGALPAEAPPAMLVAAIRAAVTGAVVVTPATLEALRAVTPSAATPAVDPRLSPAAASPRPRGGAGGPDALTEREREVLLHLGRGLTNAEIAAHLRVSETTVKTHVGHVLRKLELRDRAQAVVFAYESGLLRPGGR